MPRAKKQSDDLASIMQQRERLRAELAELDEAEKAVREAERDAGRSVLMSALSRVKIGRMDRKEAAVLARAIGTVPVSELIGRLSSR